MSLNLRRTGGRTELTALLAALNCRTLQQCFSTHTDAGIGNGTTAGRLRTTASSSYTVAGMEYSKASTDDLWDLSGETDTAAGMYRAYWLYLDSAGAASFVASNGDWDSAAAALADLPAVTETKSIIGVFVADPACDFDDAGGLAAQGTIYDGIPAGAYIGVPGQVYRAPELITSVAT